MAEECPFLSFDPRPDGSPSAQITYTPPGQDQETLQVKLPATGAEVTVLRDRASVVLALSDVRFSIQTGDAIVTTGSTYRSPEDLLMLDKPKITEIRRPLGVPLSTPSLERRRPGIEQIARNLAQNYSVLPKPADLIQGYCEPFIAEAACANLGVPLTEWQRIQYLSNTTLANIEDINEKDATIRAWDDLYAYSAELIDAKRNQPDGSVFSDVIEALDEEGLTRDQVLHTGATLLIGFPSPLSVLNVSVTELLRHPNAIEDCLNDPSLWLPTVNELMRLKAHFPLTAPRVALTDVDLGDGRIIDAGTVVLPSLTAAAHDPARVKSPDEFDISQTAPRSIVFGSGAHFCPGAAMSRQWLEVGLKELFTLLPDLRLAIPEEEIAWQKGLLPSPEALPVA
jgi:cytochrome P450